MEAQTVELLKECNSGCKMALNSIHQVMEYAEDEKLLDLLRGYNEKHETIAVSYTHLTLPTMAVV